MRCLALLLITGAAAAAEHDDVAARLQRLLAGADADDVAGLRADIRAQRAPATAALLLGIVSPDTRARDWALVVRAGTPAPHMFALAAHLDPKRLRPLDRDGLADVVAGVMLSRAVRHGNGFPRWRAKLFAEFPRVTRPHTGTTPAGALDLRLRRAALAQFRPATPAGAAFVARLTAYALDRTVPAADRAALVLAFHFHRHREAPVQASLARIVLEGRDRAVRLPAARLLGPALADADRRRLADRAAEEPDPAVRAELARRLGLSGC